MNAEKKNAWDPTESVATKPLCFRQHNQSDAYLMHDGNKNVTDVIAASAAAGSLAHYDYAPFGAVRAQSGSCAAANPYRFSSEFADDTLGLVYYNYRHYEPAMGRWLSRDPSEVWLGRIESFGLYAWCNNRVYNSDILGLTNEPGAFGWDVYTTEATSCCNGVEYFKSTSCCIDGNVVQRAGVATGVTIYRMYGRTWYYVGAMVLRPFSPKQRGLIHTWIGISQAGRYTTIGSYPNMQISSGVKTPDPHQGDENSSDTEREDISLSSCDYDVDAFVSCVFAAKDANVDWTYLNNCNDFAEETVSTCKEKAKRR